MAAQTAPAGPYNTTRAQAQGYAFRPNPQDAELLQGLAARLANYRDPKDGDRSLSKKLIQKYVRNLRRLSEWLMKQPEQSLTSVLERLETGQLSPFNLQELLTRYQANPVLHTRYQADPVAKLRAKRESSFIGASVQRLRELRTWEFQQTVDSIYLPGVAKGPVPPKIATQAERDRVANWLAEQSSTRNDETVLEQAKSHLLDKDKTVLNSLAGWLQKTYGQTDKLDCIQKNAEPDITDIIIELYKLDTKSVFYKKQINSAIMRFQSGKKIKSRRNLDEQLHADDKPVIDIIKQHFLQSSAISAFKQLAIWERAQPQPVGLAQIIANPAYQAYSKRLLTEFWNDKEIKPDYIDKVMRLIPNAQGNDALKQALSKLLP